MNVLSVFMAASFFAAAGDAVKVSSFGFDPEDSTEIIQKALDSGAGKLVFDDRGSPWVTRPLIARSNQEIVFEEGVELQAKKGGFRGKRDYLFRCENVSNIVIRGLGAKGGVFRMHKKDYQKPPYEKSEWRYALRLCAVENVLVENMSFIASGGDGIVIGAIDGRSSKNVTIRKCVCDDNHRQGISLCGGENILIEDTVLSNTKGTPPQAGIDFEPDRASEKLSNVTLRNVLSENNAGNGFEFYLSNMRGGSEPVSIRLENCRSVGNSTSVSICGNNRYDDGVVRGKISFHGCRFENARSQGIRLIGFPEDALDVAFHDCVLSGAAGTSAKPDVLLSAGTNIQGLPDGLEFSRFEIRQSADRPWFGFGRGSFGPAPKSISGDVTVLKPDGTSSRIEIDEKWVSANIPVVNGGRRPPPRAEFPSSKAVEVVDARPGEMIPLERMALVFGLRCVFYAPRPGEVKFRLRQLDVTGKRPAVERKIQARYLYDNGRQGERRFVTLPGFASETVVLNVDKAGFYVFQVSNRQTRIVLEESSVPIALDLSDGHRTVAPLDGKPFSLWFAPPAGKPFIFANVGDAFYRYRCVLNDPTGAVCSEIPLVDGLRIADIPASKAVPGLWRAEFSRGAKGTFDWVRFDLYGAPGLLFLSPEKYWKPKTSGKPSGMKKTEKAPPPLCSIDAETGNVFHMAILPDVEVSLTVSNATERTQRWSGGLKVADFDGKIFELPVLVETPPRGVSSVKIPRERVSRKSLYRVSGTLVNAEGLNVPVEARFAVIAPHPVTPRTVGKFRIGLNYHADWWSPEARKTCGDILNAVGAKIVRCGGATSFASVCKEGRDRENWTVADEVLGDLKRRGIAVNGNVYFVPKWAAKPENAEKKWSVRLRMPPRKGLVREYAEKLSRRFGTDIAYYEVGNEFDLLPEDVMTPAEAVEIQREAYEGVKAGCPDAVVINGGFALPDSAPRLVKQKGFHESFVKEAAPWFDVHAIHLHSPFDSYVGQMERFFAMREANGAAGKPWYANECAVTSARGNEKHAAVTVWKKVLYAWSHGSTDYIWYNLRGKGRDPDNHEHGYGIVTYDFHPRAAAVTFAALTEIFGGADKVTVVMEKERRCAYEFRKSGERLFGVWDANLRHPAEVPVETDAAEVYSADITGNRTAVKASNGIAMMPISAVPSAWIFKNASFARPDMKKLAETVARVRVLELGKGKTEEALMDRFSDMREFYGGDPLNEHRCWRGPSDLSVRVIFRKVSGRCLVTVEVTDETDAPGDMAALVWDAPNLRGTFPLDRVSRKGKVTRYEKSFSAVRTRLPFTVKVSDDDGAGVEGEAVSEVFRASL